MSRSMQATGSGPASSDTTLSHTARASARTHSARVATSPKAVNSSSRASATRVGEGLSRVSAGKGVSYGLAKRLRKSSRKCRCRAYRHLLTQHRANGQLKAIEGAGDAKTRVAQDCPAQMSVSAQVVGDHVGTRIEIEEVAELCEKLGQSTGQTHRQLDPECVATERRVQP